VTWLKLDDGFPQHPKVMGLSDRAFRAHVTALCYAARYLTDGWVPPGVVAPKDARELVAAGLWHDTDNGWAINDFLAYNRDRASVQAERSAKQAAGRAGGLASGRSRREASASGPGSTPVPSRPVPSSEAPPTAGNAARIEVTHDQLYLAEKLDLTVPAVQKLNTEYGTVIVTDAMRHLHGFPPEEPVESTYAYVKTLCSLKEAGR